MPIGDKGVEITTSRFENDTAVINDNGLKIKFYGSWSENNYINLRVAAFNESSQIVQIKFEQAVLKSGNNQTGSISDINEKPDYNNIYDNSKDKIMPMVSLKVGEKKSFLVSFAPLMNIQNASDSAKTFNISLPIEIGKEINNFNVKFKAVDQKDSSGKSDPED